MEQLKTTDLKTKGYLDMPVDPTLDLFVEIEKLKKEKNAVILAHYYQDSDIQDIADYIGDSLGLSQEAAKTNADIIVFAGVHFILKEKNLEKIKELDEKIEKGDFEKEIKAPSFLENPEFKKKYPDHIVITYVNCSAGIKALSDIVCTSSNAVQIVESLPKDQKIIFAPDKNLGAYIMKKTGRDMVLWNGACMVHEIFSLEKIIKLKERHPNAKFIAHPECEDSVLNLADYIGSTTALLNYTIKDSAKEFIVATESGILHQMILANPDKQFIPAPPNNNCACNDCPHMKLNTLEKVYNCLKYESPEVTLSDDLIEKAKSPIIKMLDISAKLGL